MVPVVDVSTFEILILPEAIDKPLELSNVKLYKLHVPEPEID